MTSSTNQGTQQHLLDTPLLTYSMVQNHPACILCAQLLQSHTGWFTSVQVLLETRAALIRIYNVADALATQKLRQLTRLPIQVIELNEAATFDAMTVSEQLGLDLTDAVLLRLMQTSGATRLATDDQRLLQACSRFGIVTHCPISPVLRQQIAAWEAATLPRKGLPRILGRVHDWLEQGYPQAALDFWSQTNHGNHLP